MALKSFFEAAKEFAIETASEVRGFIEATFGRKEFLEAEPGDLRDALKAAGYDEPETILQDVRTTFLAETEAAEDLGDLDPSKYIPENLVQNRPDWSMRTNYLYRIRVAGTNLSTKKAEDRFVMLASKDPLTIEDIIDDIEEYLDGLIKEYDFKADAYQLLNVYGSPGRP